MIDLDIESPLTLREACQVDFLRRNGRALNFSTMWRWTHYGALAQDGTRIKLETIKLPSGLKTSREALKRFAERLTGNSIHTPPTASQRRKSMERAEQQLDRAGW